MRALRIIWKRTRISNITDPADLKMPRDEATAKYPSTQHLPFSPGLGDGDTRLSDAACRAAFFTSTALPPTQTLSLSIRRVRARLR